MFERGKEEGEDESGGCAQFRVNKVEGPDTVWLFFWCSIFFMM